MHKLIDWFIDYVKANEIDKLWWRMDPVTNPNLMRLEHVPMSLRESVIDMLIPLIDKTSDQETKNSIQDLMSALRSTELPTKGSYKELIEYTKVLDTKRNQNVLEVFPHLKEIFE